MSAATRKKERLYQILLSPVISEKSTTVADRHGQVVFRVLKNASKDEIREAVETLFEVKVKQVRVANVRGKAKQFGRIPGMQSAWKKAYVSLQDGHDIDFVEMAGA
ncbi:MAG: 50S ribosomal protein L23 [Gammaproteobacteria bacterium]|nr:50S ribosomal protein L23 [Gammaproteobacteria bacterium]